MDRAEELGDGASRLKLGSGFSGEKVVSGVRIDKTSVSEVEKSGVRILVWSEAEDLGVRIPQPTRAHRIRGGYRA